MNFRSCKYFLAVCETGTISGAARRLFVSQQSLSQHIQKLEQELGTPLFTRGTPLALTPAGELTRKAAQTILDTLDQLETQLAAQTDARTLVLGATDYGTPDFVPQLTALYYQQHPTAHIRFQELRAEEPVPSGIDLIFTARKLDGSFHHELLLTEQLVVCLSDTLLKQQYGSDWLAAKKRLKAGDLSVLEKCPFIRYDNVPLGEVTRQVLEEHRLNPPFLPIQASTSMLMELCSSGQAAGITYLSLLEKAYPALPYYILAEQVPACYICYKKAEQLRLSARQFLELTRKTLRRSQA